MIKQIKIENYKSIPSLELDLGRVNVFIGENGCGKTNILEAVALGSAAARDKLEDEFLTIRGVRVTDPQLMKTGFIKKKIDEPIQIGYRDSNGTAYDFSIETQDGKWKSPEPFAALQRVIELSDQKWLEHIEKLEALSKKISNDKEGQDNFRRSLRMQYLELINEASKTEEALENVSTSVLDFSRTVFPDYIAYAPENTHLRRFDEEGQIRPLGIRGEGLFSHLADLARKEPAIFQKINENLQLIDWVEGFEIPNDLIFNERRIRIRDRYLDEGIQYIDQRSSNEGFLYLLFYVTLFVSPYTPKFFAIDNIDNALNPRLCAKLIGELVRLAKEHNKQVIVTAHNPGLLDGLNLNDQDQRLFVISRNKLGHTKALRIEQKPSSNGHEPVKLSEQFLRGYIGGIPNI